MASSLAAEIKNALGLDTELIEGTNGIFDVVADGSMIFSKHAEQRFPESDEIIGALRALNARRDLRCRNAAQGRLRCRTA